VADESSDRIRGALDWPQAGQVLTGFTRFEGWAVADNGDPVSLALRVGSKTAPDSPQRVRRTDIELAFGERTPDNPRPGFFVPVDTRDYLDGPYPITLLGRTMGDWQVIARSSIEICNRLAEQLPYHLHLRNLEAREGIPGRHDIYGSGPPINNPSREILEVVEQHAGLSILDVGCGNGAYVAALRRAGLDCRGVEHDRACVAECVKRGLPVQEMDAHRLDFEPKSFDTVTMIEVLEHLPDPTRAIAELFRVARQNVIISVPNIDVLPLMSKYHVLPWHLLEATHVNFFTPRILRDALRPFTPDVTVFGYGQFAPWVTEGPLYMNLMAVASLGEDAKVLRARCLRAKVKK
jgi:SAM-dependent methyltransferase